MANYLTFANIKDGIRKITGQFTGKKDVVLPYLINMVYISEIMAAVSEPERPPFWLIDHDDSYKSSGVCEITGVTQASNAQVTTGVAHGRAIGDLVSFDSIVGMTELNGRVAEVVSVPDTTNITIDIDSTGFTAWSSSGHMFNRGVKLSENLAERVISAGWNGYTPPMEAVSRQDMEKDSTFHSETNTAGPPQHYTFIKEMQSTTTGSPTFYDKNQIMWHPATDDVYDLRVVYEKKVTRMSADTDLPMLPQRFHDILISGVVSHLVAVGADKGVDTPQIWPTIYTSQLQALKQFNLEQWSHIDEGKAVTHYML